MTQRAAFVRVVRGLTDIREGEVRITFRAFWAHLEPNALNDIEGVALEYLRTVSTSQYGLVEEFRLTVKGDMARCRIVQNAIIQTMRGNAQGRRALVFLANRQQ